MSQDLSDRCQEGEKMMHLEEGPELIPLFLESNGVSSLISWKQRTSSSKKEIYIFAAVKLIISELSVVGHVELIVFFTLLFSKFSSILLFARGFVLLPALKVPRNSSPAGAFDWKLSSSPIDGPNVLCFFTSLWCLACSGTEYLPSDCKHVMHLEFPPSSFFSE